MNDCHCLCDYHSLEEDELDASDYEAEEHASLDSKNENMNKKTLLHVVTLRTMGKLYN